MNVFKDRTLKVGCFIIPGKMYKPAVLQPSLKLQGVWLSEAGITPGSTVKLKISEKKIIITVSE